MDLSHKGFEPQSDRTASLFKLQHLPDTRHAALFERLLIKRIDCLSKQREPSTLAVEGALLCSAILFGALLDRRLWSSWLTASRGRIIASKGVSQKIQFFDGDNGSSLQADSPKATLADKARNYRLIPRTGRIWIDLNSEKADTLRWVADPFTETLLIFWQYSRLGQIKSLDLVDAVTAAFGASEWEHRNKLKLVIGLQRAARAKWRMRMPGFLIEAIDKKRQGVVLPRQRWLALFEPERCQTEVLASSRKVEPSRTQGGEIGSRVDALLPNGRSHSANQFAEAARQIGMEAYYGDHDPVERLVLQWAACRLDPKSSFRQRKRRLAPSTVSSRGNRLINFLKFAFKDGDPQYFSTEYFAEQINESIADVGAPTIYRADLSCFTDWNCRDMGCLAVTVSPAAYIEGGVAAGMVTMSEYRAILSHFDKHSNLEVISRLTIILGFRAGLRWNEAQAIACGDLLVEGSVIELTIRDNSERRLKSMGSRRILPLHLLLEKDEVDELISWWRSRRIGRNPNTQKNRDPSEHWRLFPQYDRLTLKQIKHNVEAVISGVTEVDKSSYHVLRHTFATTMIATLLLPENYRHLPITPHIDPALISLARRDRLAPALLGDGLRSRDALRVVASLLGHSGERTTIRSYFHLHDWLVGIYVARPSVQPRLPFPLVARLTGITNRDIKRAKRREHRENWDVFEFDDYVGDRGRPSEASPQIENIVIGSLVDYIGPQPRSRTLLPPVSKSFQEPTMALPVLLEVPKPSWQALNTLFCSVSGITEQDARLQPELASPFGTAIADALLALLAERTRGRQAVSTYRFLEVSREARRQRVRLLSGDESHCLERIYRGSDKLNKAELSDFCRIFRKGYDRPRGVIRMHKDEARKFHDLLLKSGCRLNEILSQTAVRSATMRLGSPSRMNRGILRALIFVTAIEAAQQDCLG